MSIGDFREVFRHDLDAMRETLIKDLIGLLHGERPPADWAVVSGSDVIKEGSIGTYETTKESSVVKAPDLEVSSSDDDSAAMSMGKIPSQWVSNQTLRNAQLPSGLQSLSFGGASSIACRACSCLRLLNACHTFDARCLVGYSVGAPLLGAHC
jgi:hypothetical protein